VTLKDVRTKSYSDTNTSKDINLVIGRKGSVPTTSIVKSGA